MTHVFISYRHAEPDTAYVGRLAEFLTSAGIRVWFDQEITTGARWSSIIRKRIDSCAAMIVVMTPRAESSPWVEREITQAENSGKAILPLLLEGERFFRLADLQYYDVTDRKMPPAMVVSQLLNLGQSPLSRPTTTAKPTRKIVTSVTLACVSGILLAFAIFVLAHPYSYGRPIGISPPVTTPVMSVIVSPSNAVPGTLIEVSGTGYGRGDTVDVRMSGNGVDVALGTVTANDYGDISASLTLPPYPPTDLTYRISATSRTSRRSTYTHMNLISTALDTADPGTLLLIGIAPTNPLPGTFITVNGLGFEPGDMVDIYINGVGGKGLLGTTTADGYGDIRVTLKLPATLRTDSPADLTYLVTATGRKQAVPTFYTLYILPPRMSPTGVPTTTDSD
jgi:hypothetical protein